MSPPRAHREWVDWTQPLVPAAARWLLNAGSSRPGACTLEHVICVTPGRRAGRILLEALLRICEDKGVALIPPRFVTPGTLPEVLTESAQPKRIATPEECRFAWVRALQSSDIESIRPLVSKPPASDDLFAWHTLAQRIEALHAELAGSLLHFNDVADRAARLELFGETDRWNALNELHQRYVETLLQAHLQEPHQARLEALTDARALQLMRARVTDAPAHITLIAVTELNALQRRALTGAAPADVTAIIHAPEKLTDRFDDLGCIISEKWTNSFIDLREEQIVIADRPDDQAQAVLEYLAKSHKDAPADSITIGLGDEALVEPLHRAAQWAGLDIHRAEATSLSETPPYRLIQAVRNWIAEQRFAPFAALLRHPDIERWLLAQPREAMANQGAVHDWLTLLDRYFSDHLHKRFAGDWLGDSESRIHLKSVYDALCNLAGPLLAEDSRPISEWVIPTLRILEEIYYKSAKDSNGLPSHRRKAEARDACAGIRDALEPFTAIEESLQPCCKAATALTLFLDACSEQSLATQSHERDLEAIGWLELHHDAAPNLIVMGVNDGSVPQSITSDEFLPNALRGALGLQTSETRYARDAYLLEAISRSRRVTLIAGRRGPEGDPLTPSRLLLACDSQHLPARVLRLSDDSSSLHRPTPMGAPAPAELCEFNIYQPPSDPQPLERMRVTAFRQYLECPFRWYLSNVEQLESIGDDGDELDPLAFGILAHEVLQHFGNDETMRESTCADTILNCLRQHLSRVALSRYGERPPPAVRIQLDRLARRLEGFACFQARTRAEGWRIVQCEFRLQGCTLDIPGQQPIIVTGTIDRIDYHEGEERYRISDYKTGDRGDSPMKTHHNREKYHGEWIDLQLPLYRHLAAQCNYGGEVQLGYINLPKDASAVAFCAADWTGEQFDEAIETAREVVRNIRAGRFPIKRDFDAAFDDFANICQTKVLGRAALEEEEA